MALYDLEILDLCAGTGNISFEFISREAGNLTAVDMNSNCLRFIAKNAKDLGITEHLETIKSDILQYLRKTERKFDLIFADPPYEYKFHHEIAEIVFERELLTEGGLLNIVVTQNWKRNNTSILCVNMETFILVSFEKKKRKKRMIKDSMR